MYGFVCKHCATLSGTAAQAVVGSIVWAFRRLEKSRSSEMSARGYAVFDDDNDNIYLYSGEIDIIISSVPLNNNESTKKIIIIIKMC